MGSILCFCIVLGFICCRYPSAKYDMTEVDMLDVFIATLLTILIFISITLLMVRHDLIPPPVQRVETSNSISNEMQTEEDLFDEAHVLFEQEGKSKVINPDHVLIPDQINDYHEFKFTEKERLSVLTIFDYIHLPQFDREQLGAGG